MKRKKTARRKTSFLPKGYHTVTPYLACEDAAADVSMARMRKAAARKAQAPGG